jgi:hypothetical protein
LKVWPTPSVTVFPESDSVNVTEPAWVGVGEGVAVGGGVTVVANGVAGRVADAVATAPLGLALDVGESAPADRGAAPHPDTRINPANANTRRPRTTFRSIFI